MTMQLRLSGDEDEITQTVDALGQVLDLAWSGRTYPNRGGFGVRTYVEARLRSGEARDRQQDMDGGRL